MTEPIPVAQLEIVGYGDVLSAELRPRAVPPVYRRREAPDEIILPPYRLAGSHVFDAFSGVPADLERAVERAQATRLASPIPAAPDHILWIDTHGEPHYECEGVVFETLRTHAQRSVADARRCLVRGSATDLDEALRLAQAAISADESCLDALLVKAFVFEVRGEDLTGELAEIARVIDPGIDFEGHLAEYRTRVRQERFTRTAGSRRGGIHERPVEAFHSLPQASVPLAPAA